MFPPPSPLADRLPPAQAARQLLTLDTKDPKRLFEGPALLRRMVRFGLLGEDEKELDFVLQLTTEKMLERRLQTKVGGMGSRFWRGRAARDRPLFALSSTHLRS